MKSSSEVWLLHCTCLNRCSAGSSAIDRIGMHLGAIRKATVEPREPRPWTDDVRHGRFEHRHKSWRNTSFCFSSPAELLETNFRRDVIYDSHLRVESFFCRGCD